MKTGNGETGNGETRTEGNARDGIITTTITSGGITIITVTAPEGPYTTAPLARELPGEDVQEAMDRFRRQDWGESGRGDVMLNNLNHRHGQGTVMGIYRSQGAEFWVHQESGGIPTVLLPCEY